MVVNGGDVSTASLPAPQLHVGLPAQKPLAERRL